MKRISMVSFTEYTLFYRALLQKRPIVSSSGLLEMTLYGVLRHREDESL